MTAVGTSDKFFKRYVRENHNGINTSKHLKGQLTNAIVKEMSITRPGKVLFHNLLENDVDLHYAKRLPFDRSNEGSYLQISAHTVFT